MKCSWSMLAAAGVAGVVLSACSSAPPRAERYIPPPVGATWTYQVANSGSFGAGTSSVTMRMADGEWEGRKLLRYDYAGGSILQTDQVGIVAVLDAAGRPMLRYDPPLGFEWPLEVGKSWSGQHTVRVGPAGNRATLTANWKVESYEDVTVPAGTFKAWKVVMTDSMGLTQTIWSVPMTMGVFAKRSSERSAAHPMGGAGTQVFELVAVPAVK